jgi:hypothetical protein
MLVHGLAPAPDLHLGYTLPSVRSSLRRVVRLNQCGSPLRPTQLAIVARPDPATTIAHKLQTAAMPFVLPTLHRESDGLDIELDGMAAHRWRHFVEAVRFHPL